MRPSELAVVLAILVALFVLAILGQRQAADSHLFDVRRSTLLPGPHGAKGLAAALEDLGYRVERRRRAWFGLNADTSSIDRTARPVLLDTGPVAGLTDAEQLTLREFVSLGGSLFLAGRNGLERCFGVRIVGLAEARGPDSLPVSVGPRDGRLSDTHAVLEWVADEPPSGRGAPLRSFDCPALRSVRVDTLARALDGRPVALRLLFAGGGHVTILADSRYVSNRDLKQTDAGLMVIPWIVEPRPAVLLVDEYHHGFGRRGSIWMAAWRWMRASPAGWTLMQLALAALVGLAVAAVRFGPVRNIVQRRRRSAIEHLDALAVGLERAEAGQTAVRLIVSGLRRRLRPRDGPVRLPSGDVEGWLEALEGGAQNADAHRAVHRLRRILRERGSEERVREAALAVEDVWEALTHERRSSRS